jgi:APA family basic amino acid/polyamine antiporter
MDPGLTAALATGLGAYARETWPALAPKAVALAAIAACAALNLLGVRLASAVGHLLALAKIALLVGLVVWGFASGAGDAAHFSPFFARTAGAGPLVPALAGAAVMAFPVAVSAVFLCLVPIATLGNSSDATFLEQAGAALFGPGGGRALAALVVVFVSSTLFAFMTFAPRLYYAMAMDGAAPAFAGRLDARSGAPFAAIALQAALAALLVLVGSFDTIVAYFVFATVAFLALTVAGLYRLPRPAPGAYRVPGWPLTPLVFLLMLAVMLVLLGASSPRQALAGALVVACGVPIYRLFVAPPRDVRSPARLEET